MNITTIPGTIVNYTIEAVHTQGLAIQSCVHHSSPANMRFVREGVYDVDVIASNPLYSVTTSLSIEIKRAVVDIRITDYGTTRPRAEKEVTLEYEDIGSDACIVVDWDDGYTVEKPCLCPTYI